MSATIKKLTCLLLALAMLLSLASCGGGSGSQAESTSSQDTEVISIVEEESVFALEEESSASASVSGEEEVVIPLKVALLPAQEGDAAIQEAVKSFCEANQMDYVPVSGAADSEDAAVAAVEQAVSDGSNVVLLPGAEYAAVLTACAPKYPEVKFLTTGVSVDTIPENACCLGIREEVSGFMAGYMAVMQGYTGLAFLGRESEDSDRRYGTGFLQGADCAAMETGAIHDVSMIYAVCDQADDAAVADAVSKWYKKGTQAVFAADHFEAAAQAAAKSKGKVIGRGTDPAARKEQAGKKAFLTCAVEYPSAALLFGLKTATVSGKWSAIAGKVLRVGVVSGSNPSQNAVGLSEDSDWNDFFNEGAYDSVVDQFADKALIALDQSIDKLDLLFKVNKQTLG